MPENKWIQHMNRQVNILKVNCGEVVYFLLILVLMCERQSRNACILLLSGKL